MTVRELLAGGDFTNADPVKQVTVVTTPGGHPNGEWFLSPGPDSGRLATAVSQQGYLRLLASQGARLRQALPAPQHDVVLRALVRVLSGELLIGAVGGSRPGSTAGVCADGEWHQVDMAVTGPVDQVVLYAAADATVIDIKQISLAQSGHTDSDAGSAPPADHDTNPASGTDVKRGVTGGVKPDASAQRALQAGPSTADSKARRRSIDRAAMPAGSEGAAARAPVAEKADALQPVVQPQIITPPPANRDPTLTMSAIPDSPYPDLVTAGTVVGLGVLWTMDPATHTWQSQTVGVTDVTIQFGERNEPADADLQATFAVPAPGTYQVSAHGQSVLNDPTSNSVVANSQAPQVAEVSPAPDAGVLLVGGTGSIAVAAQITWAFANPLTVQAVIGSQQYAMQPVAGQPGRYATTLGGITSADTAITVTAFRSDLAGTAQQGPGTGRATVTIKPQEDTPPQIEITAPPSGSQFAYAGAPVTITLVGTSTPNSLSSMAGGEASVQWSLSTDGVRTSATATGPGSPSDFSGWTAEITIADEGTFTVYIWSTDKYGVATPGPLQWRGAAVEADVPSSLADRLSDRRYLADLILFANDQLATATGSVTSAPLETVLDQSLGTLAAPGDPSAATAASNSINELRVPIELARAWLSEAGLPADGGTYATQQSAALLAAYETLLSGYGTSYTELRLARGAGTATRGALADRLGITIGTTRPDLLDTITLGPSTVSEPLLETLFGLPATTGDPLRVVAPGSILTAQLATRHAAWQSDDASARTGGGWVLLDPDVVGVADVNPQHQQAAGAIGLLTGRSADLADQQGTLTALWPTQSDDQPTAFTELIQAGLPGIDIGALVSAYAAGTDISAGLTAAGLTLSGLAYLDQLGRVAQMQLAAKDEWQNVTDVLVGAWRRRQYPDWAIAEAGYCLDPDLFVDSQAAPVTSALRVDASQRTDWSRTLRTRAVQRDALTASAADAVAQAEAVWLPLLRDALLAQIAGSGKLDGDAGEALTSRYQLDFKGSGMLRTTRLAQAIQALQSLIVAVRAGEVGGVALTTGWRLAADTNIALFDAAWTWLGIQANWAAAVTTWLFPEQSLDPTLLAQTGDYATLCTALNSVRQDATASFVLTQITAYAGEQAAYLPPGAQLSYLSGRSADHQTQLAAWSHTLQATNPLTAREIFWAVPMLAAQCLQRAGQYQAALDWLWVVYPYNSPGVASSFDEINTELTSLQTPQPPDLTFTADWTSDLNPFDIVANRTHPTAPYLRSTLLAVIGCLADYGDAEFTADTDESVAHARDLYVTAVSLLQHTALNPVAPTNPDEGPLPLPSIDALSKRVTTQLAKVRQGRNIAGLSRQTPGQSSATSTISQPTPYRYSVLLTRAQQFSQQAAQLEALYLALLEKLDVGTLKIEDAQDAVVVAQQQLSVHAAQVQQATLSQAAAQDQVTKAQTMVVTYQDAIAAGPNQYEQALLQQYTTMRGLQDGMAGADLAVGVGQAVAAIGTGVGTAGGVIQMAGQAAKFGISLAENNLQSQMQANQLRDSIASRQQEWAIQQASAQQDAAIADAQVAAATSGVDIAAGEQEVAQTQADQAAATLTLLQNQFTNPDLYQWMSQTVGGVYRYFLQQATATARLAENQIAFDRAEPPQSFIAADYWQPPGQLLGPAPPPGTPATTNGMTGAERLAQDLAQLDEYAFSTDTRKLNLSQTFSLAQQLPVEFVRFLATGQLSFATPASWFDADFPGHYLRRIRQVKLSMMALVPPTRGIRASLANTGLSRTVVNQQNGSFTEVVIRDDPQTVSVTSAANATGVFDLDLQPNLLLPFEGLGVDTTWQFDLPPAANPFDYSGISDVLMTIDYTALDDPDLTAQTIAVFNKDLSRSGDVVCTLAQDFPDQWYALNNPAPGATSRSATFPLLPANFPLRVDNTSLTVDEIVVQLVTTDSTLQTTFTLAFTPSGAADSVGGAAQTAPGGLASTRRGASGWAPILGQHPVGAWTVSFDPSAPELVDASITDVLLDITWSGDSVPWQ